jgi:hypothetical protein
MSLPPCGASADIRPMNRCGSPPFGRFDALGKTDCGGDAKVVLQEPKALCGTPEGVDSVLVKTHLSLGLR